jgi:hypothetical protein
MPCTEFQFYKPAFCLINDFDLKKSLHRCVENMAITLTQSRNFAANLAEKRYALQVCDATMPKEVPQLVT